MIIGFAHLTINTEDTNDLVEFYKKNCYKEINSFYSIENSHQKKLFCNSFQETHDLILLESTKKQPTIEITNHGYASGVNEQLMLKETNILVKVPEVNNFNKFFLSALGFKEKRRNIINFKSINSAWCCELEVKEFQTNYSRVDAIGPSCLAFYSTNIIEDRKRLIDSGAKYCTDVFNINLGVKSLDIIIARVPGGVLVELIQIKKAYVD
jgi:hypothetical protein